MDFKKIRIFVLIALTVLWIAAAAGCANSGAAEAQTAAASPAAAVETGSAPPAFSPYALSDAEYEALKETVVMPEQNLEESVSSDGYTIDSSNSGKGYITVSSDTVPDKKTKVMVSLGEEKYYYDFTGEKPFATYPLQLGDGEYTIGIFENIEGDKYAQLLATKAEVELENEFVPYLLPSQIVDYNPDSDAVYESFLLTGAAQDDLERTADIYGFIVDNIKYDQQKADTVPSGYLPVVDETLQSKKGICYDYSALLACMLRVEKIPVRLVMGYVSDVDVYHAWNEIFIRDVGWVRAAIYFDGENWQIADSTFGAADAVGPGDSAKYTRIKWY